jgi:hypothetical protein
VSVQAQDPVWVEAQDLVLVEAQDPVWVEVQDLVLVEARDLMLVEAQDPVPVQVFQQEVCFPPVEKAYRPGPPLVWK